jgi:hypothetical protein
LAGPDGGVIGVEVRNEEETLESVPVVMETVRRGMDLDIVEAIRALI